MRTRRSIRRVWQEDGFLIGLGAIAIGAGIVGAVGWYATGNAEWSQAFIVPAGLLLASGFA